MLKNSHKKHVENMRKESSRDYRTIQIVTLILLIELSTIAVVCLLSTSW